MKQTKVFCCNGGEWCVDRLTLEIITGIFLKPVKVLWSTWDCVTGAKTEYCDATQCDCQSQIAKRLYNPYGIETMITDIMSLHPRPNNEVFLSRFSHKNLLLTIQIPFNAAKQMRDIPASRPISNIFPIFVSFYWLRPIFHLFFKSINKQPH